MEKPTRKDFQKEIAALIKAGKPKQQIYEEFVVKYGESRDVIDILKNIPSLAARKKYFTWNTLLLILMVVLTITN